MFQIKKLFVIFLVVAASCQPADRPAHTETVITPSSPAVKDSPQWETYRDTEAGRLFELRYPRGWPIEGGSIDYAAVYRFGSLKLIVFSAAPVGSLDGPIPPFSDTFQRFRNAFLDGAVVNIREVGTLKVEVIQYTRPGDNGIYAGVVAPGTLALWQKNEKGFALIDELDQHQASGMFDAILGSFRFTSD